MDDPNAKVFQKDLGFLTAQSIYETFFTKINPAIKDIFSFKYEDFNLINYDPHPHIKGAVAV